MGYVSSLEGNNLPDFRLGTKTICPSVAAVFVCTTEVPESPPENRRLAGVCAKSNKAHTFLRWKRCVEKTMEEMCVDDFFFIK